ncbi:MAG: DUF3604 domain-containing protein [Myxococcales bacterium]|nr:DUF3604 domain-containing protein [Myxococcales bacterium]
MRPRLRTVLLVTVGLVGTCGVAGYVLYGGGRHQGPGTIHPRPAPAPILAARAQAQTAARAQFTPPPPTSQILFGDLHVHTTFSADAFMRSLPFLQGEGAHPPADACDYARFCAGLDFFALTDHAESMTPRHWRESLASVRQCNAVAGDPADPDLVAFAGWEWSQVGATPEEHYGHKNVILRDVDEAALPRRPIAAPGLIGNALRGLGISRWRQAQIPLRDFGQRQRYLDVRTYQQELAAVPECPAGVDTRALPDGCRELAATPAELYEKLAQWGGAALVIPHGTTWGFYTPPGYTWDKQLAPAQRDVTRQRLVEVYSGHGNSEEYRRWDELERGADGVARCPAPTADHEACCWRAGELIRDRCGAAPAAECEARVEAARANYVAAGVAGHLTVPGASVTDWKDCGQCRDCFAPTFGFRPGGSIQYMLARGDFTDPAAPYHERLGLMASSDNHSARPGAGYKELARRKLTEATGAKDEAWRAFVFGAQPRPSPTSVPFDRARVGKMLPWQVVDLERQASFFMTGGLVAVHAAGRSRGAIWDALTARTVYGTSGERILLWFDLVAGAAAPASMGAAVEVTATPRFVVRAAGSFVQQPGCPADVLAALPAARLARLCQGECYHPGDQRHKIVRVEVIRIRPQARADEPIDGLIDDPWRVLPCDDRGAGCEVEFEDPDAVAGGREVLYYVRAIQEATPAINGGGLRCERVGDDACARLTPCYGDYRTPYADDCTTPIEERAWSSPIWVRPAAAAPGVDAGVGQP